MALRNQPYLPLYIQDFLTDEKLNECSALATGIYIKLMCLMHKSEQYGTILLKQKDKQTDKQIKNFALKLVKHLPWTVNIIESGLTELINEDVIKINNDKLEQKRMIHDNDISIKRSISGSIGGKKTQEFAKAKKEANSESESEDVNENVIKDKDEKEISEELIQISQEFHKYQQNQFPNLLKRVNDKLINNGAVELDKLIRIDNYTLDEIKNLLKYIVKDNFWSKRILSLANLRTKSKSNGNMKYINAMVSMSGNNSRSEKNKARLEKFIKDGKKNES